MGQGDCLFLAASQSCHKRLGRNTSALQLRLGTVAHMRLLKDRFEVLRAGNSPESGETPMPLGGSECLGPSKGENV